MRYLCMSETQNHTYENQKKVKKRGIKSQYINVDLRVCVIFLKHEMRTIKKKKRIDDSYKSLIVLYIIKKNSEVQMLFFFIYEEVLIEHSLFHFNVLCLDNLIALRFL